MTSVPNDFQSAEGRPSNAPGGTSALTARAHARFDELWEAAVRDAPRELAVPRPPFASKYVHLHAFVLRDVEADPGAAEDLAAMVAAMRLINCAALAFDAAQDGDASPGDGIRRGLVYLTAGLDALDVLGAPHGAQAQRAVRQTIRAATAGQRLSEARYPRTRDAWRRETELKTGTRYAFVFGMLARRACPGGAEDWARFAHALGLLAQLCDDLQEMSAPLQPGDHVYALAYLCERDPRVVEALATPTPETLEALRLAAIESGGLEASLAETESLIARAVGAVRHRLVDASVAADLEARLRGIVPSTRARGARV